MPRDLDHAMPACQPTFPRRNWTILLLVGFAFFAVQSLFAQKFSTGDPAAWVAPLNFPQPAKLTNSTEDIHELLVDRQVNAMEGATFYHLARHIRTFGGVERASTITVEFDPDYESLQFHWIKIWRDGKALNRLHPDKVKLIQNEPGLSDLLIFGQQSAVLVLEDVRPDDIIDYAYTIQGANPVYTGRFYDFAPLQFRVPVDRLRNRLLWPSQRRVYFTNHLSNVRPVIVTRSNFVELTWDSKQLPATPVEDSLPAWYKPDPYVQLTEFPTWAAVNQWAMKLFADATTPISPALKAKIDDWRKLGRWEDRVLAALQFVQNDVRYFGIEIGVNANQPFPPSMVFDRRFGDCKDKTFLFVTILRALSIEAYPVLINSTARQALDEWLPSAQAFDHVIAFVRFEGRSYWLDCTARQAGTLANYRPPPFERGLIVQPKTTGLTVIPSPGAGAHTTISEFFDLHRWDRQGTLKITTVAEGIDAEVLRAEFGSTAREEIAKRYLHYYSTQFPGIRISDPLEYRDDEKANRVETVEYYQIDSAWKLAEDRASYYISFYPVMFSGLTGKPVDKVRKMPLAVKYPRHISQYTEVYLPEPWPGNAENKVINGPGFRFEKRLSSSWRGLAIRYEYEALDDFVAPKDVPQYLQNLDIMENALGYGLRRYL